MKNHQGFSLIELLIVIVILGVLSAIAVPNLLAARRTANEASAIAQLKTFLQANTTYFSVKGTFGTPLELGAAKYVDLGRVNSDGTVTGVGGFGELVNMPVDLNREKGADSVQSIILKSGYFFAMVPTRIEIFNNQQGVPNIRVLEFYMAALPESKLRATPFRTGTRLFYIDSITNIPWVLKPISDTLCYPGYSNCEQIN